MPSIQNNHVIPPGAIAMDTVRPADIVLDVRHLGIQFDTPDGRIDAVDDLSFALRRGATLGIVGESGSGKSQTVLALMGLSAPNATVRGQARFGEHDLLALPAAQASRLRGNRIAMVFQDAMTALNPYLTIGRQLSEVLCHHEGISRRAARQRCIAALDAVQIPDAARRLGSYPHECSGGMRQRIMIAMALLCEPDVLIADEPTTALDVTVQAHILALLRERQRQTGIAIILITHDLGVVAESCDDVAVMYAGRVVEQTDVHQLFARPVHPYTQGLLASVARLDRDDAPLVSIPGSPPDMARVPPGCAFAPRCTQRQPSCEQQRPMLGGDAAHRFACHYG